MASSPAIFSKSHLANPGEPCEFWLTPFWFRLVVVGLAICAALLSAFALTPIVLGGTGPGGGFQVAVGTAVGIALAVMAIRFLNPLDGRRWFRFALTSSGLYLPARGGHLLFVPWAAVVSLGVERWYSKGGEHSAATLELALDDGFWATFPRGQRTDGEGRVRRIRLQVADVTGDQIRARLEAYRNEFLERSAGRESS